MHTLKLKFDYNYYVVTQLVIIYNIATYNYSMLIAKVAI